MPDQNELAQLEAERDRLLSMIAYHNGPFYRMSSAAQTPVWFFVIAAIIICAVGIAMVAGVFAGQISASDFLLLVVCLPLLAYFASRLTGVLDQPAGEPQVRQRLAECEARIMKLKEGRP
ncbi:hypothetical protein JQ628_11120 [Bradyrhizobium lablabi]|uniref:hypothetical protein n=1 Tax=Bradyrhizobium lablabi TaxID=722472 RepID=UPI001BA8F7E5|nr:hypothetical protein [Bradyrhizobium lablabi]MBR1122066.1 hypothetical protein [Bradyrhizobium lablabi]